MSVARLGSVCSERGPRDVATRLLDLSNWIAGDLSGLEAELARLPLHGSLVRMSAHHLLDLGGKRLRPMCVALAARLGSGFDAGARHLAVAVELLHNATLLHDDVIDLGERRRGAATARLVYGNAASVLAGDWLLVEALKRVRRSGHHGLVGPVLETLEKMIDAESIQLEYRGRINPSHADYFRVIEGKTAAVFGWAMLAGATAGGLRREQCEALARYGEHLGVAFQLVDDLLDVAGDPELTGKSVFADVREGKMTYPLLLALERDTFVRRVAERLLRCPDGNPMPARLLARLRERLLASGSVGDCRALARERAADAVACLEGLPEGPALSALAVLPAILSDRER